MNTINEKELVDNAKNGAVRCIKVTKAKGGDGLVLYVNLTWKEGDLLLITQKKEPRTWASADRLLAHIDSKYGCVASLMIFLSDPKDEQSSKEATPSS